MTEKEIADMPAGPEMDRLIDVEIFGWKWDETRCEVCGWLLGDSCKPGDCVQRPVPRVDYIDKHPPYSTNGNTAMVALEKFADANHGEIRISRRPPYSSHLRLWIVELCVPSTEYRGQADTFPLAACRALLKTKL